jgi:hypothetical protein
MSAIPYDKDPDAPWDDQDEATIVLPGRPRRQWFDRRTAGLVAVVACAIGFFAGVRVEKGQVSSSSSSSLRLPSAFASTGSRSSGTGARSGASGRGFPSGAAGFPGAAAFVGGNTSTGTVSSLDGSSVYVSEGSGNTVKVKLSSATKISKSLRVSKKSLRPGDSVTITGVTSSKGVVSATSVSDTGNNGTSSSSSQAGGRSGVSSLFGGSGSGG